MKCVKNTINEIKPCNVVVERIDLNKFNKNINKNESKNNIDSGLIDTSYKRNKKFKLKDLSLKFKFPLKSFISNKLNDKSVNQNVNVLLEKLNEKNIDKSNF